jgi:hypothetical protein
MRKIVFCPAIRKGHEKKLKKTYKNSNNDTANDKKKNFKNSAP